MMMMQKKHLKSLSKRGSKDKKLECLGFQKNKILGFQKSQKKKEKKGSRKRE